MADEKLIKAMERAGGKRWQKADKDRVYFDGLAAWYGLETTRYNSGNISTAALNGEGISNSKAKKIIDQLSGKVWYDVIGGQYMYQGWGPFVDREMYLAVIAKIKAAVAQQMAQEEAA